jgi:hypothetical protein
LKDVKVSPVFWDQTREGTYGVRNNMAFEALTADPSGRWVYLGTEGTLYQDGAVSDFDRGSVVRLTEYDHDGDNLTEVAQLPYPVEPIPGTVSDRLQVGTNGVSDILALSQRQLIVMERAYLAQRAKNINRLFLANCLQATDVKDRDSLTDQKYQACEKNLLLDFDSVLPRLTGGSTRIDNLEGMALWQEPTNQKYYVIFVADNNFRIEQSTQFLLFELQGYTP